MIIRVPKNCEIYCLAQKKNESTFGNNVNFIDLAAVS